MLLSNISMSKSINTMKADFQQVSKAFKVKIENIRFKDILQQKFKTKISSKLRCQQNTFLQAW